MSQLPRKLPNLVKQQMLFDIGVLTGWIAVTLAYFLV